MNATFTAPTAAPCSLSTVDPKLARAEFFFDLDMLELSATIPQADPRAVAKY